MPYPNEHACRLLDPDEWKVVGSGNRRHDGKQYRVLFAKKEGESGSQEQAYRYPKVNWTAAQARAHCQSHKGSFTAASGQQKESAMEYKAYTTSTNSVLIPVNAIDMGGEAVPVAELVAAYLGQQSENDDADASLEEATMKTVDGKKFPAGDFLVVEDPGKPSTWHLQVKRNGKADHKLMGGAKAALTSPGGHRGKKYEGPNKAEAIRKLKALYKSEDMAWSEGAAEADALTEEITETVSGSLTDYANRVEDALRSAFGRRGEGGIFDGPYPKDVFKDDPDLGDAVVVRDDGKLYAVGYTEGEDGFSFSDRGQWEEVVLTYKKTGTAQGEMAEAELSESASGRAITLTGDLPGDPRAPLLMDVALIRPGFGNKKDNHYYPPNVLKRDAGVFEGVKMYTTDHKSEEKSVRTEVAVIKTCPVAFTDDGAPIAQVAVHDGNFAEQARNRAKLGTLGSLECSILALGKTRKGKVGERETNIVEAITSASSVDFVSKAGAGGHALNLAESNTGGVKMDKEKVEKLLSESDLPQETRERLAGAEYQDEEAVKEAILRERAQGQEAPQVLAEAEVEKLVEATKLPAFAKAALKVREYVSEDALKAAVAEAVEEVKKLSGSGQVFGQGGSEAMGDQTLSEKEKTIRFNKKMQAVGGRQVPVPAE